MIVRLISSNWYSVLMNGQYYGFFQSLRGLRQRNPLSPTLFILSVEVLLKSLNDLFIDLEFRGYGLPKWGPDINYLSYADDIILFYYGQPTSMKK